MDKGEVRELLKKRGAGKIDAYLRLAARQKESESDLWNLLQTWAHCVLYYLRMYPREAFQERQMLGISVFVASSPPLKQYLDEFFNKIKPHLPHINHLKILIYASQHRLQQIHTLNIEDLTRISEEMALDADYSLHENSTLQK